MARVITAVIGGLLAAVGVVSLLGAVELARSGATTETLAQGFLVPISLFVVAGFVIYMGFGGREK